MNFSSLVIAALLQTTVYAADVSEKQHVRRATTDVKVQPVSDPSTTPHKHQPRGEKSDGMVTYFTMGGKENKGKKEHLDTANERETRIVGGNPVGGGEYPYFVDLGGCGGSLIAPNVVLTAAHCGSYRGENVVVGAYRYDSTANNAVRVSVADEVAHPNYNDVTTANDFRLLRLSQDVTVGGSNVFLSLNSQFSSPANNQVLTTMGFGDTTDGGNNFPDILRDVDLPKLSTNTCNQGNSYNGDVEDGNMFCAGFMNGGKDSCQGDSGGPIVIRNGNQHIQVGVVSWGDGCAQPNKPGVYARVSSAFNWIEQVVCDQWQSNASFCGNSGTPPSPSPPAPTPPAPTPNPPSPTPPSGGNGGGGGCFQVSLKLRTDSYGYETDLFLLTDSGDLVWNANGFADNKVYQFNTCIPNNECATLDIFDEWGDGIESPGFVKLTVAGTTYFNSGDIGGGIVFRMGGNC